MLGAQVMAKDKYKVEAYDCSQPMNIKMFDCEANCKLKECLRRIQSSNM